MTRYVLGEGFVSEDGAGRTPPAERSGPRSFTIRASNAIARESQMRPSQEATDAMNKRRIAINEARGQQAWREIHEYLGCDPQWYKLWKRMIPCGDCKAKFNAIEAEFPPDFSSPEAFFRWGVFVHNLINERLGKPIVSLEEALHLWRNDGKTEEV